VSTATLNRVPVIIVLRDFAVLEGYYWVLLGKKRRSFVGASKQDESEHGAAPYFSQKRD